MLFVIFPFSPNHFSKTSNPTSNIIKLTILKPGLLLSIDIEQLLLSYPILNTNF